jgi:trehalose/maltose hydrolase-like predicted phosphorylase
MLDFYRAHTINTGPAMTSCIHAVIAARLGRGQQSLDDFRDSYRPFERGPWDAFSEKRTTSNVYFMTGMAGALQSVLYGFAGLQVVPAGQTGHGKKLAGDAVASLYADPHLPPGWGKLVVQGIKFRGKSIDLTVGSGNAVTSTAK